MASYPPIFPLIKPENGARFADNAKRFQDFAPLLVVGKATADFIGSRRPEKTPYPLGPIRANVVFGGASAWDEESWRVVEVKPKGASSGVKLRKIKECPRCTVPCRDGRTGSFLYPTDTLKLWKILQKAFPRKAIDEEWGSWAGPFLGVYFGHANQEGTLHVGDELRVVETCRWDEHLRFWEGRSSAWHTGMRITLTAAIMTAIVVFARAKRYS